MPNLRKISSLLVESGLATSCSEANRKIKEGAVFFNQKLVKDVAETVDFSGLSTLRLGKHTIEVKPYEN